ncbi:hypothetical protein BFJ70_g16852 [Fusarium oxysporum]|nr:hypothetical protein BFJ70_g16852 [Fusarium oxysporum]
MYFHQESGPFPLDEAHPLARRTRPPSQPAYHDLIKRRYQAQTESSFRTRLRRTDELLAPCARPKLIQQCFNQEQMPPLQTASNQETADAFLHCVQSLDPLTLVIYSDGSLSSQGAASYGFTIHQGNFPVLDGSGRLGPAEVFDAEAAGALEGLRAGPNPGRFSNTRHHSLPRQPRSRHMPARHTVLFLPGRLSRVSGTSGIAWSHTAPEPEGAQPTLAHLRRIARQKPKEAFETWWSTSAPEQYKRLNLKATTGCPPELSLPRAALHHLLAARSLHGDFAAYHERFDHGDAHLKRTAASSDEDGPLIECSSQPGNRERLHQVRRTIQNERLLSEDLSSVLDDTEAGRALAPPLISLSFFLLYYLLLLPEPGSMEGVATTSIGPRPSEGSLELPHS